MSFDVHQSQQKSTSSHLHAGRGRPGSSGDAGGRVHVGSSPDIMGAEDDGGSCVASDQRPHELWVFAFILWTLGPSFPSVNHASWSSNPSQGSFIPFNRVCVHISVFIEVQLTHHVTLISGACHSDLTSLHIVLCFPCV